MKVKLYSTDKYSTYDCIYFFCSNFFVQHFLVFCQGCVNKYDFWVNFRIKLGLFVNKFYIFKARN